MDNEPTTPAEAQERLDQLTGGGNKEWLTAFLDGNGPQVAEFHKLSAVAATGNAAETVLTNKAVSDGIFINPQVRDASQTVEALRASGITEPDIAKQVLSNAPVSRAEFDAAKTAKDRLMADHDFSKRYLAGDGEARRQMSLLNVVLTRTVKDVA